MECKRFSRRNRLGWMLSGYSAHNFHLLPPVPATGQHHGNPDEDVDGVHVDADRGIDREVGGDAGTEDDAETYWGHATALSTAPASLDIPSP